jgi:hypothetical protein
MKMPVKTFLSILFHFVEAKDGISSREASGLHDLNHQTVHVLTLKIREAIGETMSSEPLLFGHIQADAAYFMKYTKPENVGMGAANSAKYDQKNAGLDENGKTPRTVSKNMHALVVFVQTGPQGHRRYRVATLKTEDQVDLLHLGQKFCSKDAILITDQHSGYNYFSGEFVGHHKVNHQREFMTADGIHTNQAEGFFARMRAAVAGAWHLTSVQNLELYGWEVAWRQTMVGRDNLSQLEDLTRRMLNSGRAKRFADYWNKRGDKVKATREDIGELVEVDKKDVRKRRGRPAAGMLRTPAPERVKRPYQRKTMPPVGAPPAQ